MTTRRTFLIGAVSTIAAPAVVRAESLMKVYSLPERYATVWGVGHDLEVIEHVLWSPAEVLRFARGPLYKFREITEIVYGFDMPLLPAPNPRPLPDNSPVVQENGFTRLMTFSELNDWRESLRPDLGGRYSVEWVQNEIRLRDEAGLGPLAWYPEAGLVKFPVT